MKNTISKTIGTAALAILMLMTFAPLSAFAQQEENAFEIQKDEQSPEDESRRSNPRALEGSWSAQVTIRNCQTGAALATFSAMNTFMRGGTMQEFSTGAAPLTRGPGHGVWSHTSGRNFTYAFQFFRFNADGTYAGLTRARRQVELSRFTTTYTATATIEIFNPAGTLVANGCATETAARFE